MRIAQQAAGVLRGGINSASQVGLRLSMLSDVKELSVSENGEQADGYYAPDSTNYEAQGSFVLDVQDEDWIHDFSQPLEKTRSYL